MTVKLSIAVLGALVAAGCGPLVFLNQPQSLKSPYPVRRVWAAAPFANESGSLHADGLRLADDVAGEIQKVPHLDMLPVNRTIMAMQTLGIRQVRRPDQARRILASVGADALVVGTIWAYDPYDPPKLGLALELYTMTYQGQIWLEPRQLRRAATTLHDLRATPPLQPASVVSGIYDASDSNVRKKLRRYAQHHGPVDDPASWHRFRISMELYRPFVAHAITRRLLAAEMARIQRSGSTAGADPAPVRTRSRP